MNHNKIKLILGSGMISIMLINGKFVNASELNELRISDQVQMLLETREGTYQDFVGVKEWEKNIKKNNFSAMDTVTDGYIVVSTSGELIKYSLDGDIVWINNDKSTYYLGVTAMEDGIVAVGRDATISKYNLDGNLIWSYSKPAWMKDYYSSVIVEDGIIVITHKGLVTKLDFDGNLMWEKECEEELPINTCTQSITVKDGIICCGYYGYCTKFDFDGNLLWHKKINDFLINTITPTDEGFILAGGYGRIKRLDSDGNIILEMNGSNSNGIGIIDGCIVNCNTDGLVNKYDFNGKLITSNKELTYYYKGLKVQNNEIICFSSDGVVVKYDSDLNVIWENNEKSYNYVGMDKLSDGNLVTAFSSGKVIKYDLNGNIIWENADKKYSYKDVCGIEDGIIAVGGGYYQSRIVKYDLNGNVLWEKYDGTTNFNSILALEDGFIIAGVDGQTRKYDSDGNKLWENNDGGINDSIKIDNYIIAVTRNGKVWKCDLDGNTIWINQDKDYNFRGVTKVEDGVIAVGVYGKVVKYDLDGNLIWENTEKNHYYTKVTTVEDGIIAVSENGRVVKYDFNGKIIWENTEKSSSMVGITTLDDGIIAIGNSLSTADFIKYITIDKTNLNKLLVQIDNMTETDYSATSWTNLQNAIKGVNNLRTQEAVENKTKEIQNAIDNLETDKTELNRILEEVSKLIEEDYSTETWTVLQSAIAGADTLTKQSEIDAKVTEIQNAIDKLDIDKSELDKLLEDVSELVETDYSAETWNKLQQSITGTDTLTKQSEIDAKVTEIQNAIDNLGVDKSELNKILEEVSELVETDYSTETWSGLQQAITGADTLTKQSEIDAKVTEIQDAIDNLGVDKSELNKILEEVAELVETDYSTESWNELQQVIIVADSLTKQSEINAKVTEIQDAIDNLDIDKSELDKLLEDVSELVETDYSTETWSELQQAITGADTLTKQSEIDAKVTEIQDAIDNLGVDKSELNKILEEVSKLVEKDYSTESWDKLQQVVNGAETLIKQSEINEKVIEIQGAIDSLGIDRSVLDKLLENVSNLNEEDYSISSWQVLQQAISNTEVFTKQSEIETKINEIQNAIKELGIDRSQLDLVIKEVENLNRTDYSVDSWNKLQEAVKNADTVTTQTEVENAIKDINDAKSALTIDRSELDKLIANVGKLNKSDYSISSWEDLQQAISNTENFTKQSEIDARAKEISNAISNLGVDKTELNKLLEEISKLDKKDYSTESWNNLQEEIENVESLNLQSEIDKKVDDIKNVMSELTVDKSKLEELIESLEDIKKDAYTSESIEKLENLLNIDDLTKQYEIDERVEEIKIAINELKINFEELKNLFDKFDKLNKEDYDTKSLENVQNIISDIKNKINNNEINEDNLDEYINLLEDAINSLQENKNVETSDNMNIGVLLAILVSTLGILKSIKKFLYK